MFSPAGSQRREVSFPDVLVLGGGGILGEAWMSAVICGLDEAAGIDSRRCGCYVGTSAGSIVASFLVAGLAPATRLGRLPEPPAVPGAEQRPTPLRQALDLAGGIGGAAAAPLAALALSSSAPGGALVRRAALRRVPHGRRSLADLGREVERSGARWDGRLRIATVELETTGQPRGQPPGTQVVDYDPAVGCQQPCDVLEHAQRFLGAAQMRHDAGDHDQPEAAARRRGRQARRGRIPGDETQPAHAGSPAEDVVSGDPPLGPRQERGRAIQAAERASTAVHQGPE